MSLVRARTFAATRAHGANFLPPTPTTVSAHKRTLKTMVKAVQRVKSGNSVSKRKRPRRGASSEETLDGPMDGAVAADAYGGLARRNFTPNMV